MVCTHFSPLVYVVYGLGPTFWRGRYKNPKDTVDDFDKQAKWDIMLLFHSHSSLVVIRVM